MSTRHAPKRRPRKRANIKEPAQFRSRKHLQWVRGHGCTTWTVSCVGGIEAAHIRTGTDGGLSVKPSDYWAVPLCAGCHRAQHQDGETTFWDWYFGKGRGIDRAKQAALTLARNSPCVETREAARERHRMRK